ncbi:MAG: hypothetical protein APF84_17705 [Gracilibacter sp. BRH_c7a]|nr:MAG: hypothetical protein APF84_17705 [Gracilibacter sp. BRH_c7a]
MLRRFTLPLFLTIILLLFFVSGCSILPINQEVEEKVSNLSADSILVNSDEIKLQTLNLIENAQKAIFIQLSSLNDPEILNSIMKKSHDGIDVRILLDQWQRDNSSTVSTLKNNNVSVQYYPSQKGQYQRVRYMVADYSKAIFYGVDWTNKGFSSYFMAVKLSGDTAWKITKSFVKDWLYTTTMNLEIPKEIDLPEENISFAINTTIRQQIIGNITSSQSDIKIIVEQLSDSDTVDALLEAKTRGIDIKLILSPSTAIATPNTLKKLIEAEIDIRYNSHSEEHPMNFNLGIFDGKQVIISSSSWTYYAFVINHESSLTIPSPEVVNKLDKIFAEEWENGTTTP